MSIVIVWEVPYRVVNNFCPGNVLLAGGFLQEMRELFVGKCIINKVTTNGYLMQK